MNKKKHIPTMKMNDEKSFLINESKLLSIGYRHFATVGKTHYYAKASAVPLVALVRNYVCNQI